MIYFYFINNFIYPFPTLKICQNPIFKTDITIEIRPLTLCYSSVYVVLIPLPLASQTRDQLLSPLFPPYHCYV